MQQTSIPINLNMTDLEVSLTEEALTKLSIEISEGDEEWLPVLATFIESKKLHYVVGFPWCPDEGDVEDEEEDWFVPGVVTEKDIDAARWKKSK
jgi:hypothetical protein